MTPTVLTKGLNSNLMKSLDPAANLQEMQRKEEYAELHHEYTISKVETGKFYGGTAQGSPKDKL